MNYNKEGKYSKTGYIAYQSKLIDEYITDGNVALAVKMINELLPKYGNDDGLLNCVVRLHLFDGEYEEALEVLDELEEERHVFQLIVILIKLNKWDRVEDLYNRYFDDKEFLFKASLERNFASLKATLDKRFKGVIPDDLSELQYGIRQACNYSEEDAILHIIKRHYNGCTGPVTTYFSHDFSVRDEFYKIKELIESHPEKARTYQFSDRYNIYYPGICEGCDYIAVVTLLGTTDILSFFPTTKCYNSIDYPFEENKVRKITIRSGLERFSSKYDKKCT